MIKIELLILDADGTLVDRETGEFLEGVERFFTLLNRPGCRNRPAVVICTIQGGPACHDAGWPWSEKYPTLAEVEERYGKLAERLGAKLYMSLIYETKNGDIILPQDLSPNDPRANPGWRKPRPGMYLQAMADAGVRDIEQVLVIGDRPQDKVEGFPFQWAQKFFARGWEKGENYGLFR